MFSGGKERNGMAFEINDMKWINQSNPSKTKKVVLLKPILDFISMFRDLIPVVHFKKRERHPWRSFSFSKVASRSLQLY